MIAVGIHSIVSHTTVVDTHHGGSIAAARSVPCVKGACGVPGIPNRKWAYIGLLVDNGHAHLGAGGILVELVHVALVRHGGGL